LKRLAFFGFDLRLAAMNLQDETAAVFCEVNGTPGRAQDSGI
jgi:hypothetical protein